MSHRPVVRCRAGPAERKRDPRSRAGSDTGRPVCAMLWAACGAAP